MNKYNAVMDESHKDNIKQKKKNTANFTVIVIFQKQAKQTILSVGAHTYLGRLQFTVNKLGQCYTSREE